MEDEIRARTARVLMTMTELEAAALALLDALEVARKALRESVISP